MIQQLISSAKPNNIYKVNTDFNVEGFIKSKDIRFKLTNDNLFFILLDIVPVQKYGAKNRVNAILAPVIYLPGFNKKYVFKITDMLFEHYAVITSSAFETGIGTLELFTLCANKVINKGNPSKMWKEAREFYTKPSSLYKRSLNQTINTVIKGVMRASKKIVFYKYTNLKRET